jgi:CBS-domain-containing membrane protein
MMESDDHSPVATVHEIVKKREAVRCHEDAILADAVRAMLDHRARHIPVVDAQGNAVGALSLMNALGAMTPQAADRWLAKMRQMSSKDPSQMLNR